MTEPNPRKVEHDDGPSRVASTTSLEGEFLLGESPRNASPDNFNFSTKEEDKEDDDESDFSQLSVSPPTVGAEQHDNDNNSDEEEEEKEKAANTAPFPSPPPPPPYLAPPIVVGRPPLLPRVTTAGSAAVVPPTHRRSSSDSAASNRVAFTTDAAAIPKPPMIDRDFSSGDQSRLSALTEASDDGEHHRPHQHAPHHHHHRQVSPGSRRERVNSKDLMQPILSILSNDRSDHSPSMRSIDQLKRVNPLETEAEAAILKAIERQISEGNAPPSVLPHLSNDMVRDMAATTTTPVMDASTPPHSSSFSPNNNSTRSSPPTRPRALTAQSQRILQQPVMDSKTATHKRQATSGTVEEKLFHLANQMDKVQDRAVAKEEEQQKQLSDHGSGGGAAPPTPTRGAATTTATAAAQPDTAVDNLLFHANVLFRRASVSPSSDLSVNSNDTPTDHNSSNNNTKPSKRFWSFERKHPKKTDQGTPDRNDDDVELGAGGGPVNGGRPNDNNKNSPDSNATQKTRTGLAAKIKARKVRRRMVGEMHQVYDFLKPRKMTMLWYCRTLVQWIFFPTLVVSTILFYSSNPRTCGNDDTCPSYSWLFIFLLIRQVITLSLAKVCEVIIIDFLSLRTRTTVRIFGPRVTLFLVQSKGWPFIIFMWAFLDIFLLSGGGAFVNHWLYWQESIPLLNEENPSGKATQNELYNNFLLVAMAFTFVVACKRLWMGIVLSKRTYRLYGKQLAAIMNDMLLISLLANLGHELEEKSRGTDSAIRPDAIFKWDEAKSESPTDGGESSLLDYDATQGLSTSMARLFDPVRSTRGAPAAAASSSRSARDNKDAPASFSSGDENIPQSSSRDDDAQAKEIGGDHSKSFTSEMDPPSSKRVSFRPSLLRSQRAQVAQHLGQWDEPPREATDGLKDMSLSAILQFRQALSYMDDDYPFSTLFGSARTRVLCVQSAQLLYEKLLLEDPDNCLLSFTTVALVARDKHGNTNEARLKRLYRMFRPDHDGDLTMLDFLAAIDRVYKEMRILSASISNSSQVDQAFEKIFNVVFYIVVSFVLLPFLGVNPIELILAVSGLIVGFAFMIGPASSQYFEGILFILVRRPFDIGDRINISNPAIDTGRDGSPGWFVEKVDLYTTTVRFATTNEVATYANGSLSRLRVINAARSPQAIVYVNIKFAVDVQFSVIEVFRQSVETFIKARTREWLSMVAFRSVRVEVDQGFVEYVVVAQHVVAWQDIGKVLQSKAELNSYCLELSKQLRMRYHPPPLPVNLELPRRADASQSGSVPGELTDNALLDAMGVFQK